MPFLYSYYPSIHEERLRASLSDVPQKQSVQCTAVVFVWLLTANCTQCALSGVSWQKTFVCPQVWYNTTELAVAWDELLSASSQLHSAANYRHDLVDVTRQALQVLGGDLYGTIVAAFKQQNITHFQYVLSLPDLLIVLVRSFSKL